MYFSRVCTSVDLGTAPITTSFFSPSLKIITVGLFFHFFLVFLVEVERVAAAVVFVVRSKREEKKKEKRKKKAEITHIERMPYSVATPGDSSVLSLYCFG